MVLLVLASVSVDVSHFLSIYGCSGKVILLKILLCIKALKFTAFHLFSIEKFMKGGNTKTD